MYGFAIYQLTGIQAGLQFLHATDEYSIKYDKDIEYHDWLKNYKTVILLDGGSTNDSTMSPGTMQQFLTELRLAKIKHTFFREPDLNDSVTAIAFLVNELAFDRDKYPEPEKLGPLNPPELLKARNDWEKLLGKQNVFMRNFLKGKRLHA